MQISNIWISIFPKYNRYTILKQFVQKNVLIESLIKKHDKKDSYFYSWVRSVLLIYKVNLQLA